MFGAQKPTELTFLPGLLRPSREGTLCLHPLERAPGAYMKQRKPCVKGFIGFLRKPRNISLFLSLFSFLIIDSSPPGSGPLKDHNNLPGWISTGSQRAVCNNDNVVFLAKFQEFWLGEIWMALNLCGWREEHKIKDLWMNAMLYRF